MANKDKKKEKKKVKKAKVKKVPVQKDLWPNKIIYNPPDVSEDDHCGYC